MRARTREVTPLSAFEHPRMVSGGLKNSNELHGEVVQSETWEWATNTIGGAIRAARTPGPVAIDIEESPPRLDPDTGETIATSQTRNLRLRQHPANDQNTILAVPIPLIRTTSKGAQRQVPEDGEELIVSTSTSIIESNAINVAASAALPILQHVIDKRKITVDTKNLGSPHDTLTLTDIMVPEDWEVGGTGEIDTEVEEPEVHRATTMAAHDLTTKLNSPNAAIASKSPYPEREVSRLGPAKATAKFEAPGISEHHTFAREDTITGSYFTTPTSEGIGDTIRHGSSTEGATTHTSTMPGNCDIQRPTTTNPTVTSKVVVSITPGHDINGWKAINHEAIGNPTRESDTIRHPVLTMNYRDSRDKVEMVSGEGESTTRNWATMSTKDRVHGNNTRDRTATTDKTEGDMWGRNAIQQPTIHETTVFTREVASVSVPRTQSPDVMVTAEVLGDTRYVTATPIQSIKISNVGFSHATRIGSPLGLMMRSEDLKDTVGVYEGVKPKPHRSTRIMTDNAIDGASSISPGADMRVASPSIEQTFDMQKAADPSTAQTTSYSNTIPSQASEKMTAGSAVDGVDFHSALYDQPIRARKLIPGKSATDTPSPSNPIHKSDVLPMDSALGLIRNDASIPIENDDSTKQSTLSDMRITNTTSSPSLVAEPVPHHLGTESKLQSDAQDTHIPPITPTHIERESSILFPTQRQSPSVVNPTRWKKIVTQVRSNSREPARILGRINIARPPSLGSRVQDPGGADQPPSEIAFTNGETLAERSSRHKILNKTEPKPSALINSQSQGTEPTSPLAIETNSVKHSHLGQPSYSQETMNTKQETLPVGDFNMSESDLLSLQSAADGPLFGHPRESTGYEMEGNHWPNKSTGKEEPSSTELSRQNLGNSTETPSFVSSQILAHDQEPVLVRLTTIAEPATTDHEINPPPPETETPAYGGKNNGLSEPLEVPDILSITTHEPPPLATIGSESILDTSHCGGPDTTEYGLPDFGTIPTLASYEVEEPTPTELASTTTDPETELYFTTETPLATAFDHQATPLQKNHRTKDTGLRPDVTTLEPIPTTGGCDKRKTALAQDQFPSVTDTISIENSHSILQANNQILPRPDEHNTESKNNPLEISKHLVSLDIQEAQVRVNLATHELLLIITVHEIENHPEGCKPYFQPAASYRRRFLP